MNYRHTYHAGNHGDVLKHALLARVLTYFKQKDSAFAVLDAHAGIGSYDLAGLEAFKTGEWREGIGKLISADFAPEVAGLLAPYLSTVKAMNLLGQMLQYPGSPELARQLLRPQDRLLLNELHPADHETLAARFAGNGNVRVSRSDALQSVKATLPFAEKRGVVLVDPPYEATDESARVARIVENALRRMAHACVMIWYPVTTRKFADDLCAGLPLRGVKGVLRVELLVRKPAQNGGMAGSGLVMINPPWPLYEECQVLMPGLHAALCEREQGAFAVDWLISPK